MTAFSIHVVEKRFPAPDAGLRGILRDVRLEVAAGEVVALLGPSGCGKSTLLSIMAGLDDDFEGSADRAPGPLAMAFQNPRLLPWRSLAQNVALPIATRAGADAEARRLLAETGLGEAADAFPEKVSVGMQRRAALCRALALKAALILMDEPLASLDGATAASMRALLRRELASTGAAAVIATHDVAEAVSLADRIISLGGSPAGIIGEWRSPLSRDEREHADVVEKAVKAFGESLSSADKGT